MRTTLAYEAKRNMSKNRIKHINQICFEGFLRTGQSSYLADYIKSGMMLVNEKSSDDITCLALGKGEIV